MPTDLAAARAPRRPAQRPEARPAGLLMAATAHVAQAALSAALQRKAMVLAGLLVFSGTAAIAWNATMRQARPHPAPLFGSRQASPPARAIDPALVLPLPASRPKDLALADPAPAPMPPSRAAAGPMTIAEALHAPETGSIATLELSRVVASAQRALTRIGLGPLKADGVMGQGTRAAIERFEQGARLPVTGALGPRTARALAARAGMPVE